MKRSVLSIVGFMILWLLGACTNPGSSVNGPPSSQGPSAARLNNSAPEIYLIYFAFDSTELSPLARNIVTQAARDAIDRKVARITINGYADKLGSNDYNVTLSESRADAVAKAMEKAGIDPRKMSRLGLGEERTVDALYGGRHVEIRLYQEP